MKTQVLRFIMIGVFGSFSLLSTSVFAENLSKEDQEALQKTQQMLRSKSQREAVINKSPDVQPYIQKMNEMGMNGSQQDKTFGISADIFETLIKDNGGDPAAVQKILLNAQKDPQGFYNSLSPEQKKMIQSLGAEMETMMGAKSPK